MIYQDNTRTIKLTQNGMEKEPGTLI